MRHRRALICALCALAVPLPALALTGGSGSGLSVSASLERCGVASGGVMCEIGASFGGADGADYYTASVAAPDGTVTDYGQVGGASGGSASLWVSYVGRGTYTVTVTAWGHDDRGKPERLDSEAAGTVEESEPARERGGAVVSGDGDGEYSLPPEEPQEAEPTEPAPAPVEPVCDPAQVPPAPTPVPESTEDAAGDDPAAATEAAPTTGAAEAPCPPADQAPPAP